MNKKFLNELKMLSEQPINWDKIDNKHFYITGGTGLIGKYFVAGLLYRNKNFDLDTKITLIGRSREKYIDRYLDLAGEFDLDKAITFIEKNVVTPFEDEINADYVIHLASNTHPRLYASDPIGTEMTNIFGTYNLLEAMKNSEGRFFLGSSGDVYGDNRSDKKYIDETDCGYIDCNTLRAGYIEGKRASEALCQAYKEAHGVDFVTGRFCRIYGSTMQRDDSKAISQFINKAIDGEDIVLKSPGTQTFSYLHIYDIVSAMLFVLTEGISGEAYNIASKEESYQLKELAEIIAELCGTKVIFDLPDSMEKKGASTFQNVILNSEKLEGLGWKSEVKLREGIRSVLNMFQE